MTMTTTHAVPKAELVALKLRLEEILEGNRRILEGLAEEHGLTPAFEACVNAHPELHRLRDLFSREIELRLMGYVGSIVVEEGHTVSGEIFKVEMVESRRKEAQLNIMAKGEGATVHSWKVPIKSLDDCGLTLSRARDRQLH